MFATPGFHSVTLVSGHLPDSVRFYGELLGLSAARLAPAGDDSPGPVLAFGAVEGGPGPLVYVLDRPGAPRGRPGIGGVHHVAFGVTDEAALLRWKRWLNDHGVPTTGPINRGYFRSLYFTDPDGQILELATAGPGYALDEPADALGRITIAHHEHLLQETGGIPYPQRTHPETVSAISEEMALTGIHHVSGITSDTERADRFYSSQFGLTRVKKTVNQDDRRMPHHFWARYDGARVAPHSSWSLFEYPERWHRAREGAGQTARVAFRADGAGSLRELGEFLSRGGAEVSPPARRGNTEVLAFRDPEGMPLELVA